METGSGRWNQPATVFETPSGVREREMAGIRTKRRKALDGMLRTLSDLLHQRVASAARACGFFKPPQDTSAIYAVAMASAPGLLDQLFAVHHLAGRDRDGVAARASFSPPVGEAERKRMLSAVRATVKKVRDKGKRARCG